MSPLKKLDVTLSLSKGDSSPRLKSPFDKLRVTSIVSEEIITKKFAKIKSKFLIYYPATFYCRPDFELIFLSPLTNF